MKTISRHARCIFTSLIFRFQVLLEVAANGFAYIGAFSTSNAAPNGVGLFRQHVSTIHHTRVSPSELANNAVVRDGLADHEVGPGLCAEDRTAAEM